MSSSPLFLALKICSFFYLHASYEFLRLPQGNFVGKAAKSSLSNISPTTKDIKLTEHQKSTFSGTVDIAYAVESPCDALSGTDYRDRLNNGP